MKEATKTRDAQLMGGPNFLIVDLVTGFFSAHPPATLSLLVSRQVEVGDQEAAAITVTVVRP